MNIPSNPRLLSYPLALMTELAKSHPPFFDTRDHDDPTSRILAVYRAERSEFVAYQVVIERAWTAEGFEYIVWYGPGAGISGARLNRGYLTPLDAIRDAAHLAERYHYRVVSKPRLGKRERLKRGMNYA